MDNFSRKILSYAISTENSMHITRNTIEEAYNKTRRNTTEEIDTKLIVDGGSENNNHIVDDYLSQ
jgi:putative transposase